MTIPTNYPGAAAYRADLYRRRRFDLLRKKPGVAYREEALADALHNQRVQYSDPVYGADPETSQQLVGRGVTGGRAESTQVSRARTNLERLRQALRRGR